MEKHMSVVTTGSTGATRPSLRDGVNKLLRARLGETGFCVTVTLRIIFRKLSTCHEGARPTRLCRPHHTARLTVLCVHRIPRPTFGDDWPYAPLAEAGCVENEPYISEKRNNNIFR
jgi:hypothetical protein